MAHKTKLQLFRTAEIFRHLFVVEAASAGFDRLSKCPNYFTLRRLRFPQIRKIHQSATNNELEELAERVVELLPGCESRILDWVEN